MKCFRESGRCAAKPRGGSPQTETRFSYLLIPSFPARTTNLQEAIAAGDSKLTAHYRRELDVLRTSALGTLIRLEIVPRASHLFLELGALEAVVNRS